MCYYTTSVRSVMSSVQTRKNNRKIGAFSWLSANSLQCVTIMHSKFDVHVLLHNKHEAALRSVQARRDQPENRDVFIADV